MVHIPDCMSGRALFWFWIQFVTVDQQEAARNNFLRFVVSVELIAQYQQWIAAGIDADDYVLESTRRQLNKYNQTLRTRSQILRAKSRLYVGKSQLLRARSKQLVRKNQLM
ncbi:hypothetical protein H6F93_08210 [Leptolyngbya sp. FACHB-671]|uniref:hypothetical protein n=1 Tax=Leptolyngbya sp. FACHB-671 TaxID=2692812 RepID=UPI001686D2F2|nr:hypothetical protein [Leptolyngbya sp. FACHB-671]MBD2067514.1 hypothetical protein [Leptolyngbya sp. FACHB-671]